MHGRRIGAGAVALAALLATACTSGAADQSAPSPSSSFTGSGNKSAGSSAPSVSATQLRSALISAADIPVAGIVLNVVSAGGTDDGIAAEFATPDGTTTVSTVISVFGTASDAGIALAAAEDAAPSRVQSASTRRLTGGGRAYNGTSEGQSVTLAVFTEGRAFVAMRFQSDLGSPIGADAVDKVVATQTTRLKAALG